MPDSFTRNHSSPNWTRKENLLLPGAKAQHLLSSAVSSGALLLSSCKKYQSLRGAIHIQKPGLRGGASLSHVSTALNSLSLLRSNSGQTRDICKVLADLRIIMGIFLFEKFCHKRILAQRSWILYHYACVNAFWQHDFFLLKWITLDQKLKC